MSRSLICVFVVVLVGSVVIQTAQPQPPAKDPQSSFEPRSGPGAGQKYLEKFVGDWEVEKTFYPRSGEPSRQKGECRQSMMHDGRFLKSEFTFEQGERKTTGTGIIGFEPASGKFTSVWTDSRQTRMSFRQSKDKFNGEEIVLFGASLDPPAGEARRSRTVSKVEDGGKKLVHKQFSINADGSERLVMELVMTRKGTALSPVPAQPK
jgi:Protein of unknown function (DUF1579)